MAPAGAERVPLQACGEAHPMRRQGSMSPTPGMFNGDLKSSRTRHLLAPLEFATQASFLSRSPWLCPSSYASWRAYDLSNDLQVPSPPFCMGYGCSVPPATAADKLAKVNLGDELCKIWLNTFLQIV